MYVDIHARQRHRKPEYHLETFYGQLEHIFLIKFSDQTATEELGIGLDTVMLAAVRNCVLEADDPNFRGLDIHFYTMMGALHFIDIQSIQCLVGRVADGNTWGIVDRSGSLARAIADKED